MTPNHFDIASAYFKALAEWFPVMCASDEFHFLPRVRAAAEKYDRLDNLSIDSIRTRIAQLKQYRTDFQQLAAQGHDLETRIDLDLLVANVNGVLIELEDNRPWQHNPLLYLKIAFIGLDHAINKPAETAAEKTDRTMARLSAVPNLFKQAVENLRSIPHTYYGASLDMVDDCRKYLGQCRQQVIGQIPGAQTDAFGQTLTSLNEFARHLTTLQVQPDSEVKIASLEKTLKHHFLSTYNIIEIFQLARDEWHNILEQLDKLAGMIDPDKTWLELYHAYYPPGVDKYSTLDLYRHESGRLQRFFRGHGFDQQYLSSAVMVADTPAYLHSVRSSASFAAAFTPDEKETSYFYITSFFPRSQAETANAHLKQRLHREYKFLTAHETFPGHQLLDTARRLLRNPIRSQIESPLFYEGWATYAETLLIDTGYVTQPIERLVDCKRRLWRSARCQIDVGLSFGLLDYENALTLLLTNGFQREEAIRQIDRFRLNPGYQLCYSLGSHEIKTIVKTFTPQLDKQKLHTRILESGQLPFHLLRERLTTLGQG